VPGLRQPFYAKRRFQKKEQEELKELIDKNFGLLELATNAGRDVKKGHECCLLSTAFVIPRDKWASTGFG
jgi:hypothetical protein